VLSAWSGCAGDTGGPSGPNMPTGGSEPAQPGQGSNPVGGNPSSPGGTGQPLTCKAKQPADTGASVLRRLTRLEYGLTLKELLGLAAVPDLEAVPADTDRDGFRSVSALHTLSAQHLTGYAQVAEKQATELMQDSARRERVLGCKPEVATCLSDFIGRFGELAYRRPLERSEIDALATKARAVGLSQTDQFQFALEVMLTSSHFLYRLELGDQSEGLSTLAPHELAARLSFALWGRGPSRELLQEAKSGALATQAALGQRARTMLGDVRAREFFSAFFVQWLRYEELRAPTEKPADWSDAVLPELGAETTRLIEDFAFEPGRRFLDVLTANYSYLTPSLAKFYGVAAGGSGGSGMQRVEFPGTHPRANSGLLSHAALIGAKSDGDTIALRGNWLRKTFLCRNLELPAGLLDMIGEELVGLSRLQILQKRNSEVACKGCHAQIDPVGVGFAAFDASGRFDPSVDLSRFMLAPALPDAAEPGFDSLAELGQKLREMPEVASCLAQRVFLYTAGRDPAPEDGCALASAADAFGAHGQGFAALVQGLVETDGFRLRRVPRAE
jgi:hypothetical protein